MTNRFVLTKEIQETDKAIEIVPMRGPRNGAWLPKSQIKIYQHKEQKGIFLIQVPTWLILKKGLDDRSTYFEADLSQFVEKK